MSERRALYTATEHEIQASILQYLELIGAVAVRVNAGMTFIEGEGGKRRAVRGAPKGCADILCCWHGRYIAIEVKNYRGKTTPAQDDFLNRVRAAGGIAIVARCAEDVEHMLEALI